MNIQAQKAIIIEQFKQVDDENLIAAIKSLLDYALDKKEKVTEIPEEDQKLVMERFAKVRANPDRLLDWEDAKELLNF